MTQFLLNDEVIVPQLRLGDTMFLTTTKVHRGPPNPSSDWRVIMHIDIPHFPTEPKVDQYLVANARKLPRMSLEYIFERMNSITCPKCLQIP